MRSHGWRQRWTHSQKAARCKRELNGVHVVTSAKVSTTVNEGEHIGSEQAAGDDAANRACDTGEQAYLNIGGR
jgi:hypothetical protein